MRRLLLTAGLAGLLLASLCPSRSFAGPAKETGADLLRTLGADDSSFDSFYDLPWDERTMERTEAFLAEWKKRLALADYDSWDSSSRIDWHLAQDWIQSRTDDLALRRRWQAEIAELLPFRQALLDLERRRGLMEMLDPKAAAEVLAAWPAEIKKVRDRLEAGKKDAPTPVEAVGTAPVASASPAAPAAPASAPPSGKSPIASPEPLKPTPVVARRAADAVKALQQPLKRWAEFYQGYRPDFSWWTKQPLAEATKAMEDLEKYLREECAGIKGKESDPLIGDPIGRETLVAALKTERLDATPEELIAIGEREFLWCSTEMKKQAQALDCGDDITAALQKVKADAVPPGQQDELVAQIGREATAWLKEKDLCEVPPFCEETWRLTMIPPDTQKVLPFAAYGGQSMMVAYPRDDMPHADKQMSLRGNNRHFTRIVTPHELIPGHHLQAFMSQRHKPWRKMMSTPFYVEGWALYWEMLLWDHLWGRTPQEKLGMLFWRRHRCARIIVSLKFHLGQMTPPQMVDFLEKETGLETLGATSEVRRFIAGGYGPLYQCGYMIGGLQLRSLAVELGWKPKDFHAAVLRQGPIPIYFVRQALQEALPPKDDARGWRF